MSHDSSSDWRPTIDRWMRNNKIRRDALIALLLVLVTLVLIAKIAAAAVGCAALIGTCTRMTRTYLTRRRRGKLTTATGGQNDTNAVTTSTP